MGDLGEHYPVEIVETETKAQKLLWLQCQKSEAQAHIAAKKEEIRHLKEGKVAELERQILKWEDRLTQLSINEQRLRGSTDV